MKTRICEYCLKEFKVSPTYPKQRCCSLRCGNKNKLKRPDPYTVETLCKCDCGTIILNPDDHYRYRKFIPEHRNSGGTHPRLGYKEDEKKTAKRMKAIFSSLNKRTPTCLEVQLYEFLDKTGLKYQKQKRIGKYVPDAFVPALNMCIFADGKYWHSLEKVVERDNRCNSYLESLGYEIVRLPCLDRGYILDLDKLRVALVK